MRYCWYYLRTIERVSKKTITYASGHAAYTLILVTSVTGSLSSAIRATGLEIIAQSIVYRKHEQLWEALSAGRAVKYPHLRLLRKALSYGMTHFTVAAVIAFVSTLGDLRAAVSIGVIDLGVQVLYYLFHDVAWDRLGARRVQTQNQ